MRSEGDEQMHRQEAVRKGCVLAFFSVVASYSNLSTFHFSGAKIERNSISDAINHRD